MIFSNAESSQNAELVDSHHLGQEQEDGAIEYKWKLIRPQPDRMQHLITQMRYRLGEGSGECVYEIGVEDSGDPRGLSEEELIESVSTIFIMAKQLEAAVSIQSIKQGTAGKVATLCVKEKEKPHFNIMDDLRVCVTGNDSVGKSTLIGVLTRGKLDDGNGFARMNVFRHRHEVFDGRTSSISHHILGFDANGSITNYKAFELNLNMNEWHQIVKSSTKLITFVDHPGHERYFKTCVLGLTAHKPHYVMLMCALDEFDKHSNCNNHSNSKQNHEWSQMLSLNLDGLLDGNSSSSEDEETEEEEEEEQKGMQLGSVSRVNPQKSNDPSGDYHKYLTMCESMNVPLFIVITKSDLDKAFGYKRLPKMLDKISCVIAAKSHYKLKIKLIETSSEASRAARALSCSVISFIPIIVVSCLNGEGLEILKTFLFSLPSITHNIKDNKDNIVEFGVDEIYEVDKVGIVASGIVRSGSIKVNDQLSIGPMDKEGNYRQVSIASIHVRRKDCSSALMGQYASLNLREIATKKELRRGMVILDDKKCDTLQHTCYSFEAHIDVLNHCELRENSQPIIHIENIRQSAHILHIHHNQKEAVFTFLHHPEFIRVGFKLIIRKSHGPIAVGRVTKILDSAQNPLVALDSLQKPQRLRTNKHDQHSFKHYLQKWHLEKKQIATTSSSEEEEEEITQTVPNSNQCPIRSNNKKHNNNKKKKKKKKKSFTLVWRSGLGFEHFYPSL